MSTETPFAWPSATEAPLDGPDRSGHKRAKAGLSCTLARLIGTVGAHR
jgi:hypothetical protein